jgi:hypothetical protein
MGNRAGEALEARGDEDFSTRERGGFLARGGAGRVGDLSVLGLPLRCFLVICGGVGRTYRVRFRRAGKLGV